MPSAAPTAPLSPFAEQIAECFSVVYPERPARSKAIKWLNLARKATTGERGIKSDEVRGAIQELVTAGLLEASIEGQRGVAAKGPGAMPGTIARFSIGAEKRGTASLILREMDNDMYRHRYRPIHALPDNLEQHVRADLIRGDFSRFEDETLPPHVWIWLTEPRAKPYLERLPTAHRDQASSFGMSYLIHTLQPVEVFAKTCKALLPAETVSTHLARARVLQGDFTGAQKMIKTVLDDKSAGKPNKVECLSLKAMIATLIGDDKAAKEWIDAALELERIGTRKRLLYIDSVSFSIAVFSLLRAGTPETLGQFKTLLSSRKKLKIESELDSLFIAAQQADHPHTEFGPLYISGPASIMSVLFAIASRWHPDYHLPEDHAGYRQWLQRLIKQAHLGGCAWAVAELQGVAEALDDELATFDEATRNILEGSSAEERLKRIGAKSLTQLITRLEPWEYSLRELEQLALKAKPVKSQDKQQEHTATRRLSWLISGQYGRSVNVSPVEQTLGKSGQWSGGRRVSLKRLLEKSGDMPHLLDQDRRASSTIQKFAAYGWGGGNPSYETNQRTVYQLVGHPHVYNDEGQNIDVVLKPPELHLSEADGKLKLTLVPEFLSDHYRTELDENNLRLYVTHFTAAQRRICESLPNGTLQLPGTATERLQSVLTALAHDISVQGDTAAATSTMQTGDPTPLLVMEPSGASLRVRIRVEPLAESGVYFDANQGGSVVYVQSQQGSVPVQRDLSKEQDEVNAMVSRSSVLSAHFDGRPHINLDTTVEALELLEEAQETNLRCIWPSNAPFKIKAKVDSGHVSLNIKSSKEWFSASGTLPLNKDGSESVSISRLLELMSAQPGARFIELGKGEFLALSKTLRQQLDTLQAFTQPPKGKSEASKTHPMALLALDSLLGEAKVKGDKGWKQLRQSISNAFTDEPALPTTLEAELRSYQLEGYHWLARMGQIGAGVCLADDMGLGKTVQALAVLLERAEHGPALVVAPTSVAGNWLQEASRFAPTLNVLAYADAADGREQVLDTLAPFDVVVISYGLMLNDIKHLEKVQWHTAVLDEAQAIKNAATHRAKAARKLNADFRIITTGTPVQNNLMDLHSLFSFLNPQLLGSASAFRQRYALPITRDQDTYAREQLQRLISPFLLRRLKRDVLKELPARTDVTLNVKLSKEEALLYETLRQEALKSLEKSDKKNQQGQQKIAILTYLMKLRRLCCNPKLVAPDWSGPMSKLDVVGDTLNELIAGGHKALVFSQFVDHLRIIENELKAKNIPYQYIDGSTPAKQRTARVNAFQSGDGDVFLISLTAGGTGLNLTAADYVIHLDPWWNPAVEDQASDRAHRLGQQRPVTIFRMVTTGTVEEQIQALHGSKRELANTILAGADSTTVNADMLLSLLQQPLGTPLT